MKQITLITSDNEEIQVSSTVKQLISSINNNNNSEPDKYNLNLDSQYIDFVLDYCDWLEEHLEDYEKLQFNFKDNVDEDYFNNMIEITESLGVLGLKSQIIQYLKLLSLRKTNYYSLDQVLQHQSSNDFWMIIDNCIYDVTKWIDKHPGGDSILSGFDRDCAYYFEIYHRSDSSFKKLNKFFIGYLNKDDLDKVPFRFYNNSNSNNNNNNNNNNNSNINNNNQIPSFEFFERLKKLCPQHNNTQ